MKHKEAYMEWYDDKYHYKPINDFRNEDSEEAWQAGVEWKTKEYEARRCDGCKWFNGDKLSRIKCGECYRFTNEIKDNWEPKEASIECSPTDPLKKEEG